MGYPGENAKIGKIDCSEVHLSAKVIDEMLHLINEYDESLDYFEESEQYVEEVDGEEYHAVLRDKLVEKSVAAFSDPSEFEFYYLCKKDYTYYQDIKKAFEQSDLYAYSLTEQKEKGIEVTAEKIKKLKHMYIDIDKMIEIW